VIGSPLLAGRDRYERHTEGWTDAVPSDALTHTVRVQDDDAAVELTAVCTPSPGYEIREARGAALSGAVDTALLAALPLLAGARMVGGFTRRLLDLTGPRAGAGLFVDAGIEVARLARQVSRLPRVRVESLRGADARVFWSLDTSSWEDLPGSCFTYGAQGRALLESRAVTAAATLDLYSPPADARKVFHRRRLLRLVRTGGRLDCFHAMHDNVHGFDVHFEIDLDRGVIAGAHSVTSRLPYRGICDEPQARIGAMVGEVVDAGLRKRIQSLLGGDAGCAQLYDLTADLLKLLSIA
jgi:Protein of unknown function (DUF2889)